MDKNVRFWTDIWYPLGRLIEIVGKVGTLNLGVTRTALICDVRNETGWVFRRCGDRQMRELVNLVETYWMEENTHLRDVVYGERMRLNFASISLLLTHGRGSEPMDLVKSGEK